MTRAIVLGLLGLCLIAAPLRADEPANEYPLGPDSHVQPGVPQGEVLPQPAWDSHIFEGTKRDWWIYVPEQYDGKTPAAVMVFQDGHMYVNIKGDMRVPTVFDNLIAKGEMPVTIGIFLNPGQKGPPPPNNPWAANNRSFEYDTVSDQYAKFILDEILPEVAKKYRLTDDPNQRAICGISSGGICAFTVAWDRPDAFRKVLTHVGSYTNIRGGYHYPFLIRKTKADKNKGTMPKPIRVFLQDGEHDVDNEFGSWWLANQEMAAAFKFAGYDYQFVGGHGEHNSKHGGSILPDSLRWLWRDWKTESITQPTTAASSPAAPLPK